MATKRTIGKILLAISLLCWAPTQMVNAQSVIKDVEHQYDQSRQLWYIDFQMRRNLSFKEETLVRPVITIKGDTVALGNSLGGVYGRQTGLEKDHTYNITWDPFQDGVTDWQDLQINIATSVRLKPLPSFWSLSWHGSNSAPFGLRLSYIVGRQKPGRPLGSGFLPSLHHKLKRLAPVGGFVEYRRSLILSDYYNAVTTFDWMTRFYAPPGSPYFYYYSQFTGKYLTVSRAITGGLAWQLGEKWYLNVGLGKGIVAQFAWVESWHVEEGEKYEETYLYDPTGYLSENVRSDYDSFYCLSCWAIDISTSARLGRWLLDLGVGHLSPYFLALHDSSFHVIGGIGYVFYRLPHHKKS